MDHEVDAAARAEHQGRHEQAAGRQAQHVDRMTRRVRRAGRLRAVGIHGPRMVCDGDGSGGPVMRAEVIAPAIDDACIVPDDERLTVFEVDAGPVVAAIAAAVELGGAQLLPDLRGRPAEPLLAIGREIATHGDLATRAGHAGARHRRLERQRLLPEHLHP